MDGYTVKHNSYGEITEIRFKPGFQVDGRYNALLGRAMMKHGNFRLDGWDWDEQTGEVYKGKAYREDTLSIPYENVRDEVCRIDDMINGYLRQFIQWREFESINKKMEENNGK